MLISMFDKSLLVRRIGYMPTAENEAMEPVMQVRNRVAQVSYVIPLESAYKYNEPKNEGEAMAAASGLFQIAEALKLATDNTSLLRLQEYIEEGLDDLVKMPPYNKKRNVVGEYDAVVCGNKISGELIE